MCKLCTFRLPPSGCRLPSFHSPSSVRSFDRLVYDMQRKCGQHIDAAKDSVSDFWFWSWPCHWGSFPSTREIGLASALGFDLLGVLITMLSPLQLCISCWFFFSFFSASFFATKKLRVCVRRNTLTRQAEVEVDAEMSHICCRWQHCGRAVSSCRAGSEAKIAIKT